MAGKTRRCSSGRANNSRGRTSCLKEANGIGTTWLRTVTRPEPVRAEEQTLLRQYVPVRALFLKVGQGRDAKDESLKRTGEQAPWEGSRQSASYPIEKPGG